MVSAGCFMVTTGPSPPWKADPGPGFVQCDINKIVCAEQNTDTKLKGIFYAPPKFWKILKIPFDYLSEVT